MTRVYLYSFNRGAAELVMLSGWLKGQRGRGSGSLRFDGPLLAAETQNGTIVMHSTAEGAEIFVESGSARIGEVGPGGVWRAPSVVKAGQSTSRAAGKQITLAPRPSSGFVDSMPHQFRDTFLPLLSRFTETPPQPKRDHEVSYPEIQPWLTIGQAWRGSFVRRFQPRLNDPAFRKALEAHLRDYPEWAPVLHPERYQRRTSGDTGPRNGRNIN